MLWSREEFLAEPPFQFTRRPPLSFEASLLWGWAAVPAGAWTLFCSRSLQPCLIKIKDFFEGEDFYIVLEL